MTFRRTAGLACAAVAATGIVACADPAADPLEFLLAGLGLMTAGVMARRGARRTTKA